MNLLERVEQAGFVGREFLVWLWYRSETNDGVFEIPELGPVELWFDGGITLKSEQGEAVETVTCSGGGSASREARFALAGGKMITRASLRLIRGEDEWTFVLDSDWLDFRSLRTPRVMQDVREDPDGLFYERIFLIEQPVAVVEALFKEFVLLRVSPGWEEDELPALEEWIRGA